MKKRYLLYILCLLVCSCSKNQKQDETVSILLPDNSEYIELLPAGLDNSNYFIRESYMGHGVFVSGQYYMLFDDSIPQYYRFPFESQYTDIAWHDGNCYITKDSSILFVEDNGKEHTILRTDGALKKIFPINEGIYFAGDTTLSFFRYSIAEAEPIIQLKCAISNIYPLNENICFITAGGHIVLINKDDVRNIHTDSLQINSIAVTSKSLFYATDKNVAYLNVTGFSCPIVDKGARELEIIDDALYVIYNDNSCAIITNVHNYDQLIQKFKEYEMENSLH